MTARVFVKRRKAPDILDCTEKEWIDAWHDPIVKEVHRGRKYIVGDHHKNENLKKSVTSHKME